MSLFHMLFGMLVALALVFSGPAMAATHKTNAKTKTTATQNVKQQIDINSADAQTLDKLKGIGEKKAQAIVSYRNKNGVFKSVDDLTRVPGIGDQFLAKLKQNNPGIMIAKPVA